MHLGCPIPLWQVQPVAKTPGGSFLEGTVWSGITLDLPYEQEPMPDQLVTCNSSMHDSKHFPWPPHPALPLSPVSVDVILVYTEEEATKVSVFAVPGSGRVECTGA